MKTSSMQSKRRDLDYLTNSKTGKTTFTFSTCKNNNDNNNNNKSNRLEQFIYKE